MKHKIIFLGILALIGVNKTLLSQATFGDYTDKTINTQGWHTGFEIKSFATVADGAKANITSYLNKSMHYQYNGAIYGIGTHIGDFTKLSRLDNNWSQALAGTFAITCSNLKLDRDYSKYKIAGTRGLIQGSISSTISDESIVAGVIGEDYIGLAKTWAGYFHGKVHINDKVGIGTKTPNSPLAVSSASGGQIFSVIDTETNEVKANPYIAYYYGSTPTRLGYIGYGSTSCNDLYVTNDKGGIKFRDNTGEAMYVKNGAVGIGTENITGTLSVKNSIYAISDNTSSSHINLKNDAGFWHISGPRDYESNNNLSFFYNNGSFKRALTLADDGKVGIGTSNPQTPLNIVSNEATIARLITLNHNYGAALQLLETLDNTTLYGFELNYNPNPNNFEINRYNGSATAQNVLTIKRSDGNIGIGTSDPKTALQVSGDISLWRTNKLVFLETGTGKERAYIRSTENENGGYNGLVFGVGNLTPRTEAMIIDQIGRVGIGVDKPASGYLLSVKGKILAAEVKVSLMGTDWADYVFDPAYQLMPLNEVASFVKKNKHLPEIPSASEVEENQGISLGEMNALLLKKIEELTLYMIEQNEKLNAQQQEVDALKAQMNQQ